MGAEITLPVALLAGLISFLSPCVLPLVPPYLCYLAGTSLDRLAGQGELAPGQQARAVASAAAFVAGFTTVFVLLGASATLIGRMLVAHLDILAKIAGVAIIVMGLHFLGVFRIGWLNRDVRYHGEVGFSGAAGAYAMGLAFAFGWTPCIGPVLAVILAMAASGETVGQGMALLAVYSLGIGLPFMAAAFAVRPFMRLMSRMRGYLGVIEKAMGVLLVLAGIAFVTGFMTQFSFWMLETFPALGRLG